MSTNLWYLDRTADRSTRLLVILTAFPVRSVRQSVRQKVMKPIIYTAQIYEWVLMIVIYGQEERAPGSRLRLSDKSDIVRFS